MASSSSGASGAPQFTMGQFMDGLLGMQQQQQHQQQPPPPEKPSSPSKSRRITLEDQRRAGSEVTVREVRHAVPTEVEVIKEVPREVIRDRLITAKRPWAVGALLGLLAAALLNFAGVFLVWRTYAGERYQPAFAASDAVQSRSQKVAGEVEAAKQKRDAAIALSRTFTTVYDRRFQALEMLRAVETCLPRRNLDAPNPADREELHIDAIDCEFYPDLAAWFAAVKPMWDETHGATGAAPAPTTPPADAPAADGAAPGPTGPGWVVEIRGHHFHNEDRHGPEQDEQFVRSTLIRNLDGKGVEATLTAGPRVAERAGGAAAGPVAVPIGAMGIGYPVIVSSPQVRTVQVSRSAPGPVRPAGDPGPAPGGQAGADPESADLVSLRQYDFIVQFCWRPGTDVSVAPPEDPAAAAP